MGKQTLASTSGESIVINAIDPTATKLKFDNDEIRRLNDEFQRRVATDEKVAYRAPKFFADILGTVYAYTFNNHLVVVRFDGTVQNFPRVIYDNLMEKLPKIMDESTPVNRTDDL